MKTCDLKEIIHLPSGIFTYTSIKTCVFYFVKKVQPAQVISTIIKAKNISYTFAQQHQTSKVAFYDFNFDNNTKSLIVDVPI